MSTAIGFINDSVVPVRETVQLFGMDAVDDIRRRLAVSKLQARRELLEIERTALLQEINSPLTSEERRQAAFRKRDELTSQWVEVMDELKLYIY